MSQADKPNPEVAPKPSRRSFTAENKRRMVAAANQCQDGELGSLLQGEGLTCAQISRWRKAQADGMLTDKKRGPTANPNRAQVRRLEAENARLKRKLEQAEAIIEAQKKLAALLDRLKSEEAP